MRKTIIGVMGPGRAAPEETENAEEIGRLIAKQGWVLLSGGRNEGVMDAVNKGAKEAKGLTIGILPTTDAGTISAYVDIPVITGMLSARNNINVLTSDIVIACGMGAGTTSEVALAIKAKKKVVLLSQIDETKVFFRKIGKDFVYEAETPAEVVSIIKKIMNK
jgi:uncharacterized protein (TIGR00725 family)